MLDMELVNYFKEEGLALKELNPHLSREDILEIWYNSDVPSDVDEIDYGQAFSIFAESYFK